MEPTSYLALCFLRKVIQLPLIVTLTLSLVSASFSPSSQWNDSDRLSLLAIKSQIQLDPRGALSSWNDSLHHCHWKGVTCSRRHAGRVTLLDLSSQQLQEYGAGGEVSIRGDVYSYGILLLEMFTRKKPTDGMFVNGLSLHDYAEMALPDQVIDIIDPMILREENYELNTVKHSETGGRIQECLVSIIRIAVTCSEGLPMRRLTMSEVVVDLLHIKKHYEDGRVNLA